MDLKHDQFLLFSKFAHLYDAGVPLAEALELAGKETRESLRGVVAGIIEDLYRGTTLADSLAGHKDIFSAEVLGILRAGEGRGELGEAARSVAAGLQRGVFAAPVAGEADLDALLAQVGDRAGIIHLEPGLGIRYREGDQLVDGGPASTDGLVAGLVSRAGKRGAFLWNGRLIRVVEAATPDGPTAIVRISAPAGAELAGAAEWRAGEPRLLLVVGTNPDAALRAILKNFDATTTKRVAVDLPVPEAICVENLRTALELDPDVVCMGDVNRAGPLLRLARLADIHTLAGVRSARLADEVIRKRSGTALPPPLRIAVS